MFFFFCDHGKVDFLLPHVALYHLSCKQLFVLLLSVGKRFSKFSFVTERSVIGISADENKRAR